jgi:DNA-binding MarR family transcriptional regulator
MSNKMLEEIKQTKPFTSRQQEAALNILRTADALKRGVVLMLKPHGITSAQYNVLRILRGAGARGLHCNGIAERMITAEPDLTRLLTRMETLGLLVRQRENDDRRVVTVTVTQRGLRLLREVEQPLRGLQKQQFALLSEDKLATLIDGLERVRESIARAE